MAVSPTSPQDSSLHSSKIQSHSSKAPSIAPTTPLESLDDLINPLSSSVQEVLRQRRPVVVLVSHRFISRILITAPAPVVWKTLTDYSQFAQFLPTVISSQVLESKGDRHIVEQVDARTILFTPVRTTVRTENIEIPQKRINFRLVGGDMKKFDGHWQLYPVTAAQPPDIAQTLLLQSAEVDAGSVFFASIVQSLLIDSLKANISAIRDEAERRIRPT